MKIGFKSEFAQFRQPKLLNKNFSSQTLNNNDLEYLILFFANPTVPSIKLSYGGTAALLAGASVTASHFYGGTLIDRLNDNATAKQCY